MYGRVLQNILAGKCPHVDSVPEMYVTETGVFGIHIAAAIGKERLNQQKIIHSLESTGLIFGLNAMTLGIIKCKQNRLSLIRTGYVEQRVNQILLPSRSNDNENCIKVDDFSPFEFAVLKTNVRYKDILGDLYSPSAQELTEVVEFSIKHDSMEIQDVLLEQLISRSKSSNVQERHSALELSKYTCKSAIVFNRPGILDKTLKHMPKDTMDIAFKSTLGELCSCLRRKGCSYIIDGYKIKVPSLKDVTTEEKLRANICTLWALDFNCSKEVKTVLQPLPHTTLIQDWFEEIFRFSIQSNVVYTIFDTCLDIDNVGGTGMTPLEQILNAASMGAYEGYRNIIELIISKNPCVNRNPSAVKKALDLDCALEMREFKFRDYLGNYITDTKEHGVCGHSEDGNFALNFYGPLLIECGFPYKQKTIVKFLRYNFHPSEQAYLRRCLDTPRSLKILCRDKIRDHFKGSAVL